ncbi:MAG: hypothetical protein QM714_15870 [Nocardioides sp.]|uniref:hypothetical protein n=1 Tax=Nocardioides sp. TaxID=35761 RepID=UPI0039E598E0
MPPGFDYEHFASSSDELKDGFLHPFGNCVFDIQINGCTGAALNVTGLAGLAGLIRHGALKALERQAAKESGTTLAANALPTLPKALSGGAADTYVYLGANNGKNVYVGITNNLARRQGEHGARFALDPITSAPVTRGQARAIEQALIVRNPGFQNVRNSISPNHAYYDDAVSWGESWLKQNGF